MVDRLGYSDRYRVSGFPSMIGDLEARLARPGSVEVVFYEPVDSDSYFAALPPKRENQWKIYPTCHLENEWGELPRVNYQDGAYITFDVDTRKVALVEDDTSPKFNEVRVLSWDNHINGYNRLSLEDLETKTFKEGIAILPLFNEAGVVIVVPKSDLKDKEREIAIDRIIDGSNIS